MGTEGKDEWKVKEKWRKENLREKNVELADCLEFGV